MVDRLRHGLTYANVMSTIAVVVAVGGGAAYAANTVFSSDIVNGEVKSVDIDTAGVATVDIAPDAVNSAKIANGAVETAEIANGEVRSADVTDNALTGGDVLDNALTGADVNESSLAGVNAETVDGLNALGFAFGDEGVAAEGSFATVECSSGCFNLLGNPPASADYLDGAFKVESCADGGLMLNYENQSSSAQTIRQVRHDETGSFVTKSSAPAGTEGNFFFTSTDQMRRLEAIVLGSGLGQARYDIYTEHEDSANPSFSDLCTGTAYVSTIFDD